MILIGDTCGLPPIKKRISDIHPGRFKMTRDLTILIPLAITLLGSSAAAMDTSAISDAPDLSSPKAAIAAKDYVKAATELKSIAQSSGSADAYSLLGFALRKGGQPDQALVYYNKALELDPAHKGALEYQGELFVELGQIDKAKQNLTKLDRICMATCEEAEDLKEAIEHATASK